MLLLGSRGLELISALWQLVINLCCFQWLSNYSLWRRMREREVRTQRPSAVCLALLGASGVAYFFRALEGKNRALETRLCCQQTVLEKNRSSLASESSDLSIDFFHVGCLWFIISHSLTNSKEQAQVHRARDKREQAKQQEQRARKPSPPGPEVLLCHCLLLLLYVTATQLCQHSA